MDIRNKGAGETQLLLFAIAYLEKWKFETMSSQLFWKQAAKSGNLKFEGRIAFTPPRNFYANSGI